MSPNKKSSHVPGPYLGYALQATRVTARLLQAEPCWKISLEVIDDVGIETGTDTYIVEQNKSTHGQNPISDRSVDLWKTFANWFDAVRAKELDSQTTQFVLYISNKKSGEIVQRFHSAKSRSEALSALQEARNELWGPPKDYPLKAGVAATLAPHLNRVFSVENKILRNKLLDIICNFSLICGSGSPQEDLKAMCQKSFVADDLVDDLLCHAQGWVKKQIDTKLEKGLPAIIERDEFHNELVAYHSRLVTQSILRSVSPPPDSSTVNLQMQQPFVRQLDLIDCEDDDKLQAARCWLQASADRTDWSVTGAVHFQDFQELELELLQVWKNNRIRARVLGATSTESDIGKLLYAECGNYKAKIQGKEVPSHFTPGSFHCLSNSLVIGWHPNYKEILVNEDLSNQ